MAYTPTVEQAKAFAEFILAGVPAEDAIAYADPELAIEVRAECATRWKRHPSVLSAQIVLMGGQWTRLSEDERMRQALRKHYNEMAYFLATHNYGELETAKASKADKCREALETKLAGMAGKKDALTQFWADAMSGKLKLATEAVQ